MMDCIFCKIVSRQIPKELKYEDENIVAFDDIHPVAKTHILFVPKEHIKDFSNLTNDNVLASLRRGAQKIIGEQELMGKGYRIVANGGGAQVINHLHFHLIGPIGLNAPVQ